MIPIEKIRDIVKKHDSLEKELSTGKIDSKLFAQKSKEYSSLGSIIKYAREFIKFESEIKDLEQLIKDKSSCLLYTSPSPRDGLLSRMPSSA